MFPCLLFACTHVIINLTNQSKHLDNLIRLYTFNLFRYNKNIKSKGSVKKVSDDMTRLELLTLLLSIKALLESDNDKKALELINEVIAEAKRKDN